MSKKRKKKKKERRDRRLEFPSLLFVLSSFYAGLSIPSVTVPASCALTESRNYSLIRIKKRRHHPVG